MHPRGVRAESQTKSTWPPFNFGWTAPGRYMWQHYQGCGGSKPDLNRSVEITADNAFYTTDGPVTLQPKEQRSNTPAPRAVTVACFFPLPWPRSRFGPCSWVRLLRHKSAPLGACGDANAIDSTTHGCAPRLLAARHVPGQPTPSTRRRMRMNERCRVDHHSWLVQHPALYLDTGTSTSTAASPVGTGRWPSTRPRGTTSAPR